jgi:magnesium transporter
LRQADEIASHINQISEHVQSTEDIINISLDAQRNALLLLELRLTMGTFAVGSGGLLCAMFGMNLQSGLETSPLLFWVAGLTSVTIVGGVFSLCLRKMRKVAFAAGVGKYVPQPQAPQRVFENS